MAKTGDGSCSTSIIFNKHKSIPSTSVNSFILIIILPYVRNKDERVKDEIKHTLIFCNFILYVSGFLKIENANG